MPRMLGLLQTVLTIGGLLMIYWGRQNDIPLALHSGVYLLATGLILLGVITIGSQSYVYRDRQTRMTRVISGATAMAFGMMSLLAGAALMVGGFFLISGRQDELVAFLDGRPAVIALALGIAAILFGAAGLIGSRGERDSVGGLVKSLPGRIFGLILLLFGIGVTLAGAWGINDPSMFNALWNRVVLGIFPVS